MPPAKEGAKAPKVPKVRSRGGCWTCKNKKVKCGEERPICLNCSKAGIDCDYNVRLNWTGKRARRADLAEADKAEANSGASSPPNHVTPQPSLSRRTSAIDSRRSTSDTLEYPTQNRFRHRGYSHPPATTSGTTKSPTFMYKPWNLLSREHTEDNYSVCQPELRYPTPIPLLPNAQPHWQAGIHDRMHDPFLGPRPTPARHFADMPGYIMHGDPAYSLPQLYTVREDVPCPVVSPVILSPLIPVNPFRIPEPVKPDASGVYGWDQGRPDSDIGNNLDHDALMIVPGLNGRDYYDETEIIRTSELSDGGFAFGVLELSTSIAGKAYYERPVAITIPQALDPLPQELLRRPMKLMYFHHYINNTAKVLVPFDCADNPFKTILPQMAIRDKHVMSLLVAYSATHRAQVIGRPEPANRVAYYLQDVFQSLSQRLGALNELNEMEREITLALAIMLASFDIINPKTFEHHQDSWQMHIEGAREIITSGGGQKLAHRNETSSFLYRWFTYIDVIRHIMSGTKYDTFPIHYHELDEDIPSERDLEVDCMLGFPHRSISILSKIAKLAKTCDRQRTGLNGVVHEDWKPSQETMVTAEQLKQEWDDLATRNGSTMVHYHGQNVELSYINNAFRYAGMIHLYRRVLGHPPGSPTVQMCVGEIIRALDQSAVSSASAASMVFPIFMAGCEAINGPWRGRMVDAMRRAEGCGMAHVRRARVVMEEVWSTGRPWQMVVHGEFLG